MNKILIAIVGFIVIVGGVAAFVYLNSSSSPSAPTPPHDNSTVEQNQTGNIISIDNMAFSPADFEVKVGDTVIWNNNDTTTHTVTSDNGVFDSGQLNPGGSYSFTFTEAGTFPYHCVLHPYMKGQITVTE